MASSHLSMLKAMCLNAEIVGRADQREALGWALARLNELSGTRVADALSGKPSKEIIERLEAMQDQIDELDRLVDWVCSRTRSDRKRHENTLEWSRLAHG